MKSQTTKTFRDPFDGELFEITEPSDEARAAAARSIPCPRCSGDRYWANLEGRPTNHYYVRQCEDCGYRERV